MILPQKRFDTFHNECMAVVVYLKGEGRLIRINAEASEGEVYPDIQRTLTKGLCLDLAKE